MRIFLILLAATLIQQGSAAPPPTTKETEATTTFAPTPAVVPVHERAYNTWSTLAEIGIWVALLVFVGATVTLIVEALKRRRQQKDEHLKRYSFHVNSMNERLFEEELNL